LVLRLVDEKPTLFGVGFFYLIGGFCVSVYFGFAITAQAVAVDAFGVFF